MAPRTYTADNIDWSKYSETINATVDQMTRFGYTVEESTDSLRKVYESFSQEARQEARERKQRTVKAMRPFMDLLTDPKVLFLRRWIDVECPLRVDGSRPAEYMDVDPGWLVTIGVAVNIESREIEFWASSPTSTMCWPIDPRLHGSIDHLTTASVGILTSKTLEAMWIEVLADLAESEDGRFTNDPPKPLTKQEREAVERGRELGRDKSLADLLRDAKVTDQWAKAEDWERSPHPPPLTPGSPPGTYTLTSDDNYFSTIFDSVTAAPDPDEGLTIEKMMDLSKQLKDAKINHKKNSEYFSILDINTTA